MSLRFFNDHCVPMQVANRMREEAHEVFVLRDVLPQRAPDTLVITKAQELDRVLGGFLNS